MWLMKVVLMEDKEEVLNGEMQDAEVPTLTEGRSKEKKNELRASKFILNVVESGCTQLLNVRYMCFHLQVRKKSIYN